MYLLLLSYKEEKSSCPCETFPGSLEKKGSLKSTVLVSLGWNTWSQLRLSLLAYCKAIKREKKRKNKTKKNMQQSTRASDAKNTRQFLCGMITAAKENWNANEYEAKTPNIVALTVYYESSRLH